MLVQIEFLLALPGGNEFGFGEVGFLFGHACTHDGFALRSDVTPLSIGVSLVFEEPVVLEVTLDSETTLVDPTDVFLTGGSKTKVL